MWLFFHCLPPWFAQPHPHGFFQRKSPGNQVVMGQMFVGLTLQDKLVSSKHFIPVHLKILSRSIENMALHLLTKFITWSTSCQPSFKVKNLFKGFHPTRKCLRTSYFMSTLKRRKKKQQQPTFSRMTQQCASRQINRRWFWAWPRQ